MRYHAAGFAPWECVLGVSAASLAARPDTEGGEVDADEGLVDLAADAGGEEVLFEWVGEVDLGHDVARECQVDPGVALGAGDAGEE